MDEEFQLSPFVTSEEVRGTGKTITIDTFRRHADSVFDKIDNIKPTTQEGEMLLEELKAYQSEEMGPSFDFIEANVGLTHAAADRYVGSEKNIQPVLDSALLRIKRETSYFDYSQGEEVSLAILSRLKGRVFKDNIFYLSPDAWFLRSRSANGGHFSMFPGVIVASNELPDDREMLSGLAIRGTLPELASIIDHELVHKKAYTLAERYRITGLSLVVLGSLMNNLNKDSLPEQLLAYSIAGGAHLMQRKLWGNEFLQEVHAHTADKETPYYQNDWNKRPYAIMGKLQYYKSFDGIDRAVVAFNHIRALRLLNVPDAEIAQIAKDDKYDENHRWKYPLLSDKLEEKLNELGIRSSLGTVIDCLHVKHQLELITQRNLAKVIASQELRREAGDVNWREGDVWLEKFGKLNQSN